MYVYIPKNHIGKLWWYVGAGSNKKILWSYDGEFVNGKKQGNSMNIFQK